MLPIGPLMIEHRLIERVIVLMRDAAHEARAGSAIDAGFIDATVDFIRVYADAFHHGKEEDILFRDVGKKPLADGDRLAMERLMEDHRLSRGVTGKLDAANAAYRGGDSSAAGAITTALSTLVDLYPRHIALEDKTFFPAAMKYLSKVEKDAMLAEMRAFDAREGYREKYARVVSDLEAARGKRKI